MEEEGGGGAKGLPTPKGAEGWGRVLVRVWDMRGPGLYWDWDAEGFMLEEAAAAARWERARRRS